MLAAVSLIPMIGIVAFSIELGRGYQTKIANQSIADAAALAAANAYTTVATDAMLTASANEAANANGLAASNIAVTRVANYNSTGGDAVQVVVTKSVPIYFGRIFSTQLSYPVSATSVASLTSSNPPPCVIALASLNIVGVSQTAGNTLAAPQCAVQSNSGLTLTTLSPGTAKMATASGIISVSGGSSLTADKIIYGMSIINLFGSLNGPTTQKANSVTDPLAANANIAAARALLGTAPDPAAPAVTTGNDLSLSASTSGVIFQGIAATLINSTWTLPAGTYNFRNVTVNGTKLNILGPSTVTVSGTVTVGLGGGFAIGDGTVSIRGLTMMSGTSTMTLGAGRHYFGPLTVTGASKVTTGAGDLDVNGLTWVSDPNTAVSFGAGRYTMGDDGIATSISLLAGASFTFANGEFSATNNIITTGGGTLTFGAATNHILNGMLSLWGTTNFGSGSYVIDGLFTNNAVGTMTGSNVSFVMSGALNATYGTSIRLSAPTSGSSTGIRDVLFATSTIWPTLIGGGSQDDFSGTVYSPNAPFLMTGGASSSGSCFVVIAQSVMLTGGRMPATACTNVTGAASVTLLK